MRDNIENFLGALEIENEFSANTVSAYRNDLGQFVRYLQDRHALESWPEVEPSHLTSYVLDLREREYATSTVARKTAAVKSFFGFMTRNGDLRADPSEQLSAPRVEKYAPRALPEHEVQVLLDEPAKVCTPESIRDRAMLQLLYSSGMRVSELVSLDVEDLNLDGRTVRCTGKQNRQRVIEVPATAARAVAEYLDTGRPAICRNPEEMALFLDRKSVV